MTVKLFSGGKKLKYHVDCTRRGRWINVREYRRGIQKWTETLATYGAQSDEKQSKNTTQYVLDTTMRKQTQQNVNKTW
jgi:hypothetical protein